MSKDMNKDKNEAKKTKKRYFKDFKAELKKVIWPTPKQLANNTLTVIVMVLITAVIVFVLDLAFESLSNLKNKGAESLKASISTEATNQVEDGVAVIDGNNSSSEDSQVEEASSESENQEGEDTATAE